jgi:Ca2+-binding RTX toxin-like protein
MLMTGASAAAATDVTVPDLTLNVPGVANGNTKVLGPSTATVGGSVDPNGLATNVHIEYGSTDALGLSTPAINVGAGGDPQTILANLKDLRPGSTVYYRIVATNSAGSTSSTTQTFNTPPATVNPATGQLSTAPGAVKCTKSGTSRSDKIKGTKKRDVICGLGGNDHISGLGGNDVIYGGTGNDVVSGGAGKDRLEGNAGKDRMNGQSGADRVDGGAGNDTLTGSTGKDRISGGNGNDTMIASRDRKGGDRVNGGKGRDKARVNKGDRTAKTERVKRTRR